MLRGAPAGEGSFAERSAQVGVVFVSIHKFDLARTNLRKPSHCLGDPGRINFVRVVCR